MRAATGGRLPAAPGTHVPHCPERHAGCELQVRQRGHCLCDRWLRVTWLSGETGLAGPPREDEPPSVKLRGLTCCHWGCCRAVAPGYSHAFEWSVLVDVSAPADRARAERLFPWVACAGGTPVAIPHCCLETMAGCFLSPGVVEGSAFGDEGLREALRNDCEGRWRPGRPPGTDPEPEEERRRALEEGLPRRSGCDGGAAGGTGSRRWCRAGDLVDLLVRKTSESLK